jgi:hypothetical protein
MIAIQCIQKKRIADVPCTGQLTAMDAHSPSAQLARTRTGRTGSTAASVAIRAVSATNVGSARMLGKSTNTARALDQISLNRQFKYLIAAALTGGASSRAKPKRSVMHRNCRFN